MRAAEMNRFVVGDETEQLAVPHARVYKGEERRAS
jgi:hypothetical protein